MFFPSFPLPEAERTASFAVTAQPFSALDILTATAQAPAAAIGH